MSNDPARTAVAVLALAGLLCLPAASARAQPQPVRVVFEFSDTVAGGQYSAAERPGVEKEVSRQMALHCEARLRYWKFEGTPGATLTTQPASPAAPVLKVWLRRGLDWRLCAALEGPEMAGGEPWEAVLYRPTDAEWQGLPPKDVFPRDVVDQFKFDNNDPDTLLRRHGEPIRLALQTYVPIAHGTNYKYVGPNPLLKPADALGQLPLDTTKKEFAQLARSKFRIEGEDANGTEVTAYVLARRAPAPAAGGAPPALWARLWEWHEAGGEPTRVATLAHDLQALVLKQFAGLKCKLIYLSEYVPDGTVPAGVDGQG